MPKICYASCYGRFDFEESSPDVPAFVSPMDSACVCVCLRRLAHLFSEAFACPAKDSLQKNRCYYSARSRLTSARFLPADV